jgi:cell division protein FtsB
MPRVGQALGWVLPFGLLAYVIVAVPLRMLDEEGLPRYRALRAELHEVRRDNQRTRREIKELQRTIHRLKTDPSAIERLARDELGMLREGEIRFQFPQ